ncbi:MAG: recombinase family protein, partial [Adlercreutzia equolifaciens]
DGEVAAFVPRIFELAAQGRWWRSKLEGQVRELGCPGPRQRANELYGHNRHAIEGWDYAAIRSMVTNPFYTGDFAPERLASIRMRKSGIPIGSFPVIEGHHPALVGRELFEEANEGLARNRYACPTKAEGRSPAVARKSRKAAASVVAVPAAPAAKVWRCAVYARLSCRNNGLAGDSSLRPRSISCATACRAWRAEWSASTRTTAAQAPRSRAGPRSTRSWMRCAQAPSTASP